jgi:cytochrome c553
MRIWVSLAVLFGMGVAIADIVPNIDAGRQKSQVCVACHMDDGNSVVPAWPKIAGQPEKYFIEQLNAFKMGDKGGRFNPVMMSFAAALSDQDMADLAAFYASQKTTPGATQQNFVALGEKIYRGGNSVTAVPACSACHSPRAEGNIPAGFPPLSGQHPDYIIEQLKAFKSGARSNDVNGIMRDIAKRMTDEEIQAVSNYVSGLH